MQVLLATILFLTTVATVQAQTPVPTGYFGLTIHRLAVHSPTTPWPSFPVGIIRLWDTPTLWPNINPARGVYDWSGFDAFVEIAARHNADVVFVLGKTPKWASSNPNSADYSKAPPANLEDWDTFVRAVVTRAAGRVKYWEIWNEAQETSFYTGTVTQMVELARRAYSIIKNLDPSAKVLTPSVVGGYAADWMDRYLAAGGGYYADIMAFHGYADEKPETIVSVVNRLKTVFGRYGLATKPIWNTEASWGESFRLSGDDARASFVAKQFLLNWSLGVERFIWYAYDNSIWGTLWSPTAGLAPAGRAYIEVQQLMVGNTLTTPFQLNNGVWSGEFTEPDGSRFTVTWNSGSTAMPVRNDTSSPPPAEKPRHSRGKKK